MKSFRDKEKLVEPSDLCFVFHSFVQSMRLLKEGVNIEFLWDATDMKFESSRFLINSQSSPGDKRASQANMLGASIDVLLDGRCFDLTKPAGFLFLVCKIQADMRV